MEKQISSKSTKNEILEAYNKVLSQLADKKPEPLEIQKEKKEKETIKRASLQSNEIIVKNISDLKMNISATLDNLEDKLVNSFKEFEKLHEATNIEKTELDELYEIKTNSHSLAALIAAQKEEKEKFELIMKEKKQDWEKEEAQHVNAIKEEKETGLKGRKREEDEFQYNLKINRKKEQDIFNEKKILQEKALAEKKINFDKEITEREAEIIEAENELKELRKKAEEFPGILEKEVAKAKKETETLLKQQFDFEKKLNENKITGESKLKDQIIENLTDKIKDQDAVVKQLTQKVNVSEESVKQIALKALESSGKERLIRFDKSINTD